MWWCTSTLLYLKLVHVIRAPSLVLLKVKNVQCIRICDVRVSMSVVVGIALHPKLALYVSKFVGHGMSVGDHRVERR